MYLTSASSRLLLHGTNNWDLKKAYGCYDGILRHISWSDDGKYILEVNAKGMVEILSANDNEIRTLQHIPIKDTWSASFHREGHRNVAIGTKSGNVMIWDTKNKLIAKTFPTPSQQSCVIFISYNARNTMLAATMQNGDTVIYGLVSNIPVHTVRLTCSRNISAMKFHHDSRSLIGLATDEGHVIIRDTTTNKEKALFEDIHASPVSDIAYSLINKDVILSSGYDKIMHVYDIRMKNIVSSVKSTYPLTSLSINMDNIVALGTQNGLIEVYDLRDLTTPYKVLSGHEAKVNSLAFQPAHKKTISTDVSLREESINKSPQRLHSPICNKTSDMFFITDSPVKTIERQADCDDSFLLNVASFSKSNTNDFDNNQSFHERKNNTHETFYQQLDVDKSVNKISTPLNNTKNESLGFTSPVCVTNTECANGQGSNVNINNISSNSMNELKDFIKFTVAEVSDDNRNYFLHVMMALTKEKLFLEKELASSKQTIQKLEANQNLMLESITRLTFDMDSLKSQMAQMMSHVNHT